MIRPPAILMFALGFALLAGCGDREGTAATAATSQPPATASETMTEVDAPSQKQKKTASAAGRGKTIESVRSQFGRIVADGRGQAVYVFDKETTSKPDCYGACAKAWPPVLTKGRPVAGKGARAGLLGTTRRRDGRRQVTLDGKPLYYYVEDTPGQVLCHNVDEFGGLWLVVRPDGAPVP